MSRQRTKTEIMRHEQYFAKLIEKADNAMREYQQERGGEHRLYVDEYIQGGHAMNRRIRKKKQKQWEQQQARIEQAIVNLLELVEEARRDYWRRWAEESTKQFVAEVMRHYEPRGRKEELQQSQM